ncbi:MAG: acyl-CoA thioesterase [Sphingomonadaceae bacterium]
MTSDAVGDWDGRSAPALLALERLDRDLFRNRLNQRNANDALFGGQVLAQALTAASATVEGGEGPARAVHSLHGYFLRAGRAHRAVIYQVERTRDGGRFSTRRVTAVQEGEPIFHMECGFHAEEGGFDHQLALPAGVPAPDTLRSLAEIAADPDVPLPDFVRERWARAERPIEVKPVDWRQFLASPGEAARRTLWMRLPSGAGADAVEQACLLAYLSDYWLAGTAALPHAVPMPGPGLFMASLDHAMWFHRPADVSGWLLFQTDSPSAQAGRGLARGLIHGQDGRLVASVAQEALLRPRR